MTTFIRLALLVGLLFKPLSNGLFAAPKEDSEIASIKAVYIYHFATFAQWPGEAGSPSQKEIRLCVLGGGEVAVQLQRLDGKDLEEGRLLRVLPMRREESLKPCNMVFIGETVGSSDPVWLKLRGAPILWVSDQASFAQQGGMIEMFLRDDKIRMRINLGAVRSAGITLSSKLLRLAEIVEAP